MSRFLMLMIEKSEIPNSKFQIPNKGLQKSDTEILNLLNETIKSVDELIEKFRFAEAGETIYHFMWDEVANKYLEEIKSRQDLDVALPVLRHIILTGLKLLHPFMPFVTEVIWREINPDGGMLIVAEWPSNY